MDPIFEEEGPRSRLALLCNTPGDDIVEIIASGDGRAGNQQQDLLERKQLPGATGTGTLRRVPQAKITDVMLN
jgi:hypothetical protein